MIMPKNDLKNRIKLPQNLSSLPLVVLKLMEACQDADATPKELAPIISQDPSLTAQVMRLVNSASMSRTQKIRTIEAAAIYLGVETLKNLAVSVAVLEAFNRAEGDNVFDLKQFRRHSFLCASLARQIAVLTEYPDPEEAFLAGLLHDIGKLVLWETFRDRYSAIIKRCGNVYELLTAELGEFGATHSEVGAWLIERWRLQSFMADACRYHHDDIGRILQATPLLKIVYVANALSREVPADDETGLEAAKAVLGLASNEIMELVSGIEDEVAAAAESLGLSLSPPAAVGAEEVEEGEEGTAELADEVKSQALLLGLLHNLLQADSEETVIRIILRGLLILFDVREVVLFLHDLENGCLKAFPPPDHPREDLIRALTIPMDQTDHLPVMALTRKEIFDTFVPAGTDKPTITDEQTARLLGGEGLICVPLVARDQSLGVIVIGVSRQKADYMFARKRTLRLLAGHAAQCLRVQRLNREQVWRIVRERQEASATIARVVIHEVNNPLGIIKNYLNVLGTKLIEQDPVKDELRIISEEITRVGQIILKLASYSGPGAGRPQLFDVNVVLADTMKILNKSLLQPAGISVDLALDRALPKVESDRNSLVQVIMNLIKNAVEAMPDGGRIAVETKWLGMAQRKTKAVGGGKGGWIRITIRDNGPGIPEHIKAHLFEPSCSSKDTSHFGLGLYIAHSIVKELKGSIHCRSEEGVGTAFQILLPNSQPTPAQESGKNR